MLQRIGGFSEYVNKNQLQQDHPCVIRLIKQKYLRQPASKSLPYRLGDPQPLNPSDGPAQGILRILRNQVNLPLLVLFVCEFVLIFNFSFFCRPTDFSSNAVPTMANSYPTRYTWSDPSSGADCSSRPIKYRTVNS